MKLIRYTLNNAPEDIRFGVLKDKEIFSIEGDVFSGKFQIGSLASTLDAVTLKAPCLPSKVVGIAINFEGIDNFSAEMAEPMVFVKPASCVCGPYSEVKNPFPELKWWGEAELAVVIGKMVKNITEEDASDAVFGFTIANDTTVENINSRDHHLARAKCPDDFCAIGPWIDTDFDASNCLIEAIQNGQVIRKGMSSDQFWQWPKIISWLSTWMTLLPGDVVLTGNPPDTVGMRYLESGDTYTAKVHGLGELTNKFIC